MRREGANHGCPTLVDLALLWLTLSWLVGSQPAQRVESRVWPGCHSLEVQLVNWHGDGDDANGRRCDPPVIANPKCDPFFYICVDKFQP